MRFAANLFLYAGIAACGYIGTSEYPSLLVKFYAGLFGVTLLAIKALMSDGGKRKPETPSGTPNDPISTEEVRP